MMSTTTKKADDNIKITGNWENPSTKLKEKIHNKSRGLLRLHNRAWLVVMLLSVFMWQYQKDDFTGEVSGICPEVISTDPASDVSGVLLETQINATFNVAMNVSTINSTTFTLKL